MYKLLQPSFDETANARALTDNWYVVLDGGRMLGQEWAETSTTPGMAAYRTLVMFTRYGAYKKDTKRSKLYS